MPTDLRTLLRDAAHDPVAVPNFDRIAVRGRRERAGRRAGAAVAVVLVAAVGAVTLWSADPGPEVPVIGDGTERSSDPEGVETPSGEAIPDGVVPEVVGLTREEAEYALRGAGYEPVVHVRSVTEADEANRVLAQLPPEDTTARDGTVQVLVGQQAEPWLFGPFTPLSERTVDAAAEPTVLFDQAAVDEWWGEDRSAASPRLPELGAAIAVVVNEGTCHFFGRAVTDVTLDGGTATVHLQPRIEPDVACRGGIRLTEHVVAIDAAVAREIVTAVEVVVDDGVAPLPWQRPAAWPGERWQDEEGVWVETLEVVVQPGPAHCDWEDIAFLTVDPTPPPIGQSDAETPPPFRMFARSPTPGLLAPGAGAWDPGARLPDDAEPSGYHTPGWELWFAESDAPAAYLVADDGHAERWPLVEGGCS